MTTEPRYPGARVRVSWTVTDETLDPPALADPTAQTVLYGYKGDTTPTELQWPDDAAVVHDAEGEFHVDVDCPDVGTVFVDIVATEGLVGATETSWRISRPAFATT